MHAVFYLISRYELGTAALTYGVLGALLSAGIGGAASALTRRLPR
jgi:hypothetical protein